MDGFDFIDVVNNISEKFKDAIDAASYWDDNGKIENEDKLKHLKENDIKNVNKHFEDWKKNKDKYNIECPDICAGKINNGNVDDKSIWFYDKDVRKKNSCEIKDDNSFEKNILIILESPHDDEYKDDNFINPALGSTGKSLQKHFADLIKTIERKCGSSIGKGNCRIILMNSIPYQCSLGKIEGKLLTPIRDLIFNEIWKEEEIKNRFKEKLTKYNPDYIFNFCTKGGDNSNLRDLVQERIEEYVFAIKKKPEMYMGDHPSRWDLKRPHREVWEASKEEKKIQIF